MGKGQNGSNLGITEHSGQYGRFLSNIFIIAASKTNLHIRQLQFQITQIGTDMQNQLQELFFGELEHQLGVLRSGFRCRPTITHDDRRAGIAGGRTTVAVWHTADRQHRVIEVIDQCLCLALVQFGGQILDFRFILRVNVLVLDRTLVPQLGKIITGNVNIVKQHERLNELFYTVKTVAVHRIDSVQQGKDDLESTQPSVVRRVFDNGNTE